MLKRFFCDDLIPIGFETPQEHVGGAHGTQTSCYACHHKLDPMAGFFRSYGAYFFDYSRSGDIIFDDLASKDRALYKSSGGPEARRTRPGMSATSAPRDGKPTTATARRSRICHAFCAPRRRSKRCLVKRLHEYIVSEDQAIDRGYLDYLTHEFEAEANVNSSTAVKNTIVRILQNDAYAQRDADPKRCHDLAPGSAAGQGPPCRVAFILSKNCGQCHNAGSEDRAGRLDVNSWMPAPDGNGHTFRHVDEHMAQLSARDSLGRIIERLSSSDAATRMPKGKVMPNDERQELFLWAQEELAQISEHVRQ